MWPRILVGLIAILDQKWQEEGYSEKMPTIRRAAAVFRRPQQETDITMQYAEPVSHYYDSQRLKLHYVDWGNPGAPPLLMIHGGYDHCRSWDDMARGLCRDYHILAPDLRGHGDSQWDTGGAYLLLNFAYDIAELVERLDVPSVRIISHSFGGFVSLIFAGLFPERASRLLVIDPFIHYSPQRLQSQADTPAADLVLEWVGRMREAARRVPRAYATLAEAEQRLGREHPHLSPGQIRHLTLHGVRRDEAGAYCWKYDHHYAGMPPQLLAGPECMSLWSRIACSVLFIRGDECSETSDPGRNGALAHFRDGRSISLPKAGHWVHHNQLERVLLLARDFLKD